MTSTSTRDLRSRTLSRSVRSSVKFTQSIDQPINLEYEWQRNEKRVLHRIKFVVRPGMPTKLLYGTQNFSIEGLSKPLNFFKTDANVEIFVQTALTALRLKNDSLAVGGLGNEVSNEIVMKIVKVAAANHVATIYTGIDGIVSRPAMSCLTRKHHCWGFLVHNCRRMLPNYDDEVLSIDLIDPNGGPIAPYLIDAIILVSQLTPGYMIVPTIAYGNRMVNSKLFVLIDNTRLTIFVEDTVSIYVELLKSVFDFDDINELLSGAKYFRPFRILIDCNGGAVGPYARRIFEVELGAGCSVVNYQPSDRPIPLHPSKVGFLPIETEIITSNTDFGATLDTDGGRVILYGQRGFHIPAGETLAIITSHYQAIPYFQKHAFNGVSRAVGTTSSVEDAVHKSPLMLKKCSGSWLSFNQLMDRDGVLMCEDEYFGVGSHHVGCSDGIWTILAWLTMVIHLYKPVMNIMTDHWTTYGRCFLTVYEFHYISREVLSKTMNYLRYKTFPAENFLCSTHTFDGKTYKIIDARQVYVHGRSGKGIGHEDVTLRVRVKPRGLILFKTVLLGDEGTFRTTVEVHSKVIPHTTNKRTVTEALFKLAMAISRIGAVTGKSTPDLIY